MAQNNFLFRIKGIQRYEGNEPEVIELTTEGRIERRGEQLFMIYEESALTGLEGTVTRFELEGEKVRLIRTGKISSVMEFLPGQTTQSLYDTGMGALLIDARTLRVENHMDETGGNLTVVYRIAIESLGVGEIEYRILATPL